jgi:arabinofuranosyltransferase
VRGRALPLGAAIAALGIGVGVFLWRTRQIAGSIGVDAFPLDDSWIHMQFARNLAEGRGFAYNPGVPVSGSTAPLWTLLLGGTFTVLGAHPVLAKALGLALTLGTAWLAGRLAGLWTGHRGLGLLASALTALAGPMVWGALSGMEVSLAAFLVTASLLLRAQEREGAAAVALGLGTLARPEAIVLLPLFWLSGPLTWRRALRWVGPVAACAAPWVAFNLATIGSPLPGTAAAKIEGGLLGALSGVREPLATTLLRRPGQYAFEWGRWLWGVDALLPLLVLPGLGWLARRWGRAALAPACVLLAHPLAMALLAPYRGPGFQEGRYSIHLLPLALVVAVAPLAGHRTAAPAEPDPEPPPPSTGRRAFSWGRGAGVLALLVGALAALPGAASRYAWGVQNIEAMQVHLARWVTDHTPATARLGLNDVGAIAYFSRREIVDVMGLVTPAILPYRREGETGVLRYLERACPDYLIVFPAWFPTLSAMTDRFQPVYRVRLDHNTVAGADELVVYETIWSRWRADRRPCPDALAGSPAPGGPAPAGKGRDRIIGSWSP